MCKPDLDKKMAAIFSDEEIFVYPSVYMEALSRQTVKGSSHQVGPGGLKFQLISKLQRLNLLGKMVASRSVASLVPHPGSKVMPPPTYTC